jgi:hypothetical protein
MKKKLAFLFISIVILFVSCNDPIFYNISIEEKILDPLIEGSPTNFVEFGSSMYVASGATLWEYKKGKWSSSNPGGRINALAVTNDVTETLYALCEETILSKSANNNVWITEKIPADYTIKGIYAAEKYLFIGAYNKSTSAYCICILNGTFSLLENTGNRLLRGAAYDGSSNYYLPTIDMVGSNGKGGAIYTVTDTPTLTIIPDNQNIQFMGIISNGSNVYAISRSGDLYDSIGGFANKIASFGGSYRATGALAIWTDGGNTLLLAGRQGETTSYTHGYMELNITGGYISGNFEEPGKKTPSTLHTSDDNGRYQSTIGKNAVNFLYQSDVDETLFASTQKNGVWSYRYHKGMWHWNAEE